MIKSCMKEKKERGFEDELLGLNIDLEWDLSFSFEYIEKLSLTFSSSS